MKLIFRSPGFLRSVKAPTSPFKEFETRFPSPRVPKITILCSRRGFSGLIKNQQHFVDMSKRLPDNAALTKCMACLPTCFGVEGKNIEVLSEPKEFYDKILDGISKARRRIVLSSLYLGNGALEQRLAAEIKLALDGQPTLKAHVLLDYTRGSRGEHNSRSVFLPCLDSHTNRMTLSLFHTPNLRGVMKHMLPDRFNELLGLQHMKFCVFDDTLLVSGANLSHDYFTNRQDRYILIRDSPELCDFFIELIHTVSQFCYQTTSNNKAQLNPLCQGNPTKGPDVARFINFAQTQMQSFLSQHEKSGVANCCKKPDTWIYPLIQMGSFNINNDYNMFSKFLKSVDSGDIAYLATAYFNPLEEYIKLITDETPGQFHFLAASPQVNGFYQAAGVAGYIPAAYTWYEKVFLSLVNQSGQSHRISLHEYKRDKWTFHAKGLWYYPKHSSLPTITVIGSSNFGYRSVHRDLEAQVLIATENADLQQKLHKERERIYSRSDRITALDLNSADRYTPLWVRWFANLTRTYF